eukprot:PITA_32677
MGQVWSVLENLFKYRVPDDVLNKVTDNVFDNLTGGTRDGKTLVTKRTLTYGRLHEALTAVFKKINETIPGAKCIVPSKDFIDKVLKESGIGKREEINREEFSTIVRKFSDGRLVVTCAKEVVIVTLAVVANVILLPKIGILIAKVPPSIFFPTVAFVAGLIANKFFHKRPPSRNQ